MMQLRTLCVLEGVAEGRGGDRLGKGDEGMGRGWEGKGEERRMKLIPHEPHTSVHTAMLFAPHARKSHEPMRMR